MATEEKASLRGPLPVGVGTQGAPLPMASFLLMNMLFVLF